MAKHVFVGPGKHYFPDKNNEPQKAEVGKTYELTADQAKAFSDRFKPEDVYKAEQGKSAEALTELKAKLKEEARAEILAEQAKAAPASPTPANPNPVVK